MLSFWEYFIPTDYSQTWRQHVVFSKDDGKQLKKIITQRYATVLVFMSLLLNAEINVLFSPSDFGERLRHSLETTDFKDLHVFIGILLCSSILTTFLSIIATISAWGTVDTISDENLLFVLRSVSGNVVTNLPFTFVGMTLFLFFGWFSLAISSLILWSEACIIFALVAGLFINMTTHYSYLCNVIMKTGAMTNTAIFDDIYKNATAEDLEEMLYKRAISITKEMDHKNVMDSLKFIQDNLKLHRLENSRKYSENTDNYENFYSSTNNFSESVECLRNKIGISEDEESLQEECAFSVCSN